MGFPSPSTDYIEQRVTPASVCMTPDSRILETSAGYRPGHAPTAG